MYQPCCETPESRSCVGWRGWQNLSESSIIAGEATHLSWHSCLGSDTSVPAVAPTSAAGLVLTGSSVALWNTTASAALSAADGLRDTKRRVRGPEVIFWVEMSLRLKLISYQPAALLTWKKSQWPAERKLKCKLIIIGLILTFAGP